MAKFALFFVLYLAGLLSAKGPGDSDSSESPKHEPTPSSSSSQTATSTTSPSSSTTAGSATGILTFSQPSNTTTCDSTTFSWVFEGNTIVPLTILVVNSSETVDFDADDSVKSSATLTTDLPSNAGSLVWDPVDVEEGTYSVVAFDSLQAVTLHAQSDPFFVAMGKDASCVAPASSASTTSTTSSSPTPPPSSSSSSDEATSSSKSVDPRALAGAIIGAVGAFVVLGLAFLAPQWLRHHLPRRDRRNVRAGGPYYLF